jgi:hypothetical protein
MYRRKGGSVKCRLYLNKTLANHGLLADVAEEALVVPGQGLKSHKLGAAQASLACVPPAHIFCAFPVNPAFQNFYQKLAGHIIAPRHNFYVTVSL